MTTAVVWPAPQIPGTGGCPSCDWVSTEVVPDKLVVSVGGEADFQLCAQVFDCTTSCPVAGEEIETYREDPRLALELVGGSYDGTAAYSRALTGCTATRSSLAWSSDSEFQLDVWADYRAGVWTGMMQIRVYSYYLVDNPSAPCTSLGSGCCALVSSVTGTASMTAGPANDIGGAMETLSHAGLPTTVATACPWGVTGALIGTITVYDDGTITIT